MILFQPLAITVRSQRLRERNVFFFFYIKFLEDIMAHSHCTGMGTEPGQGPGPGPNVYIAQGLGTRPGNIMHATDIHYKAREIFQVLKNGLETH